MPVLAPRLPLTMRHANLAPVAYPHFLVTLVAAVAVVVPLALPPSVYNPTTRLAPAAARHATYPAKLGRMPIIQILTSLLTT